jgi:hypothetical protein
VVADEVSGGCDGAGDGGALLDVAADEEECGAGVVAGENFEEALGGDVVGAVVVGEGDLAMRSLPKSWDWAERAA